MAGIYVHIPFCRKACAYCDFHFSVSLQKTAQMAHAIAREAAIRKDYFGGKTVGTVYFGGGTPSILSLKALRTIVESIRSDFIIDADAEQTLEANPDDISDTVLEGWQALGFNRLSIGSQSFRDQDLVWMGRAHTAQQTLQALEAIKRAGLENHSIDLIYGIPGLSDEAWIGNIETVLRFGVPHISCYALTVEEKTPLHQRIAKGLSEAPLADDQARQYDLLMERLGYEGYEHYETSNFALPGHRSKHNTGYWKNEPYLGLGPSAHSYNGKRTRHWNVSNNSLYIAALEKGSVPMELETLSDTQALNEYIMVGLRTMEGISFDLVEANWGQAAVDQLKKSAERFLNAQLIKEMGGRYCLTQAGRHLADGIAAQIFFT